MKYLIGETYELENDDFIKELDNIMIQSNPYEIDNAKRFANHDEYNNDKIHMNNLINSYEKYSQRA